MARANTKQQIIDAAVQLGARQGISGASMDQIAEAAGVAKGSLYYNFNSKDELFAEVMRLGYGKLSTAIDEARAAANDEDAPREVARATLITLRDNVDLAKLMVAEVFRTDRPWASAMNEARGLVVTRLRDSLRAAATAGGAGESLGVTRAGAVEAERITETSGAAFFGALAGACLDWLLFRSDQSLDSVLDEVPFTR